MFFAQQFLPGILAAAVICAVLLGSFACLRRWNIGGGWGWTPAAAIGLGYAGGHAVVAGWPALPPHSVNDWLLWFALAGGVAGVLDALLRPGKSARLFLWVILYAAFLRLLLRPKFQYDWTAPQGILWVAGFTLGMVVLSWCLERSEQRQVPAFSLPLTLTIVAAGTSAALMLSGSMLLGQLASVLSAAVGTWCLGALLLPRWLPEGRGAVPVTTLLLVGLWICGYYFAELPAASALLLPLALVFSVFAPAVGMANGKKTVLQAVGVSGIVIAAVFIALRASPPFPY